MSGVRILHLPPPPHTHTFTATSPYPLLLLPTHLPDSQFHRNKVGGYPPRCLSTSPFCGSRSFLSSDLGSFAEGMEACLYECVRASLRVYMYRNASFLCERLCAEFPSEVSNIMTLAHLCYRICTRREVYWLSSSCASFPEFRKCASVTFLRLLYFESISLWQPDPCRFFAIYRAKVITARGFRFFSEPYPLHFAHLAISELATALLSVFSHIYSELPFVDNVKVNAIRIPSPP